MTTATIDRPQVTTNPKQELYAIPCGEGYSTMGFRFVQKHCNHIAELLGKPALRVEDHELGTIPAYDRYRHAVQAWGESSMANRTYFGPGVPEKLQRMVETLRRFPGRVRVVQGDTKTGESWLDLNDVVGEIVRSTGTLRVPLLLPDDSRYGGALSCDRILLIRDMEDGKVLWQAPTWKPPVLNLIPASGDALEAGLRWTITGPEGQEIASFEHQGKAAAALAFLCGEAVEPRIFND